MSILKSVPNSTTPMVDANGMPTRQTQLFLTALAQKVTAGDLAPDSVNSINLVAGSVVTSKLADGSVVTTKIPSDTISTAQILDDAIISVKLKDGSVTAPKMPDGVITTPKLADLAITETKISPGSISTPKIQANAITTNLIQAGAITTDTIAANAITTQKIQANAITTNLLAASCITSDLIAAGAVIASKMATDSIVAKNIVAENITTAKISVGAVTTSRLAPNSASYTSGSSSATGQSFVNLVGIPGATLMILGTFDGAPGQSGGGQLVLKVYCYNSAGTQINVGSEQIASVPIFGLSASTPVPIINYYNVNSGAPNYYSNSWFGSALWGVSAASFSFGAYSQANPMFAFNGTGNLLARTVQKNYTIPANTATVRVYTQAYNASSTLIGPTGILVWELMR